jgi:hypothetical protein
MVRKWVVRLHTFFGFGDFCMNEIIFMFVEIQQDGSNKFVRRVNKIKEF